MGKSYAWSFPFRNRQWARKLRLLVDLSGVLICSLLDLQQVDSGSNLLKFMKKVNVLDILPLPLFVSSIEICIVENAVTRCL